MSFCHRYSPDGSKIGTEMKGPRGTILHLIDTGGPGGAETVFLRLVSGLRERGWNCIPVIHSEDWLHQVLVDQGFRPLLLSTEGSFDGTYLSKIIGLISSVDADLIQTHLLTTSVYGCMAGRIRRIPTVSTFHGPADAPKEERLRDLKFRLINRKRGRVVFVSEFLREWFLNSTPLRRERTQVIENGVVFSVEESSLSDKAGVRQSLGSPPENILIGAVGNIRPSKDYETLIQSAAIVKDRGGDHLRFVVAGQGGGGLRTSLSKLIRQLQLERHFRFLGFRSDIQELYGAFDIFVLSSSAEGFSLVTVEAMAHGLPVVATRCGGPEHIISDGTTGILVEPGNPEALAQAILRLSRDARLRDQLGSAARREVSSGFSVETMVAAYEKTYTELLEGDGELASENAADPAKRG